MRIEGRGDLTPPFVTNLLVSFTGKNSNINNNSANIEVISSNKGNASKHR